MPVCAAMQNREEMGARLLEILTRETSTRNCKEMIAAMAETAAISRSAVSAEVEKLLLRRFDELSSLLICIDGLIFGDHTMIGSRVHNEGTQ